MGNQKGKYNWILILMCLTLILLTGCNGVEKKEESSTDKSKKGPQVMGMEELKKNLDRKDSVIVDLRNDDAYNGFKVDGVSRGGHIENAIQFPEKWVDDLKESNDKNLAELLKEKGITKDKKIILYHSQNDKTSKFANELRNLGYDDVFKFESLKDWAKDEKLPMIAFPKFEMVVSPEWVNAVINGEKPETFQGGDYLIIETSWGPESEAYNKGHIPGSVHFNTDNLESEPLWNFGPIDLVEKSLEKFGITPDTTVIVYSDDISAASREVLGLLWAGVKDVRLLNGGMKAWEDAGFKVEKEANKPNGIEDFGLTIPQHPEYTLPMPKDVLEKQKDPNFKLVSIRSWDEFIGKTSGYSYIKETGEPKGAVWGHAGSDAFHMEDYSDVDGTLRNLYEIEELWAEWDIKKENDVSFYCGTGWRASVPWIAARMLGWEDVTVFDGGWHVWVMDKNNPVQKGDPRK